MSAEGPKNYPVVYDADNGLQYSYQTGYEQIVIAPSTDVTVGDINSEASTDGQVIASNGDGTASWADPATTGTVYSTYVPTITGSDTVSAVSFHVETTGTTVTIRGYYIADAVNSDPMSFTLPTPMNAAHLPTGVSVLGVLGGAADAVARNLFYDGSSTALVFVWAANSAGSPTPLKSNGGLLDSGDGASVVFTYPI